MSEFGWTNGFGLFLSPLTATNKFFSWLICSLMEDEWKPVGHVKFNNATNNKFHTCFFVDTWLVYSKIDVNDGPGKRLIIIYHFSKYDIVKFVMLLNLFYKIWFFLFLLRGLSRGCCHMNNNLLVKVVIIISLLKMV